MIGFRHKYQVREAIIGQPRWQRHVGVDIGVDDDERAIAQQWQGAMNTAAGLEDVVALGTVRDVHAVVGARADSLDDLLAEPAEVYDDVPDPGIPQPIQVALEKTAATDLDQRLRRRFGDRPQPFAAAGGEQHCVHASTPRPGNTRVSISSPSQPSSSYRGTSSVM